MHTHVHELAQGEGLRDWQRKIQHIMDEMRNRSFYDFRATGTWLPTINIYQSREAYYICVELAGLEHGSLEAECPDTRHVRISGHRGRPQVPRPVGPCSMELMEIDEGPFMREIDLNDPVRTDAIEMHSEKGYVWIILRKTTA